MKKLRFLPLAVALLFTSVVSLSATTIKLSKSSVTLNAGKSTTIKATVSPKDMQNELVWESEDESVATIENGKITAVAGGSTVVKASVDDISRNIKVSVKQATSKLIVDSTLSLPVGEKLTLNIERQPATANDTLTIKSSNSKVV